MKNKKKYNIYLDDVRTPTQNMRNGCEWIIVRSYEEFISKVDTIGLEFISFITLDHDLGHSAMQEYHNNTSPNYIIDYNNITEKTGYDCAKWLVEKWLDGEEVVDVYTHSANPVGSANIMGYINNYLMNIKKPQTCVRIQIPHTADWSLVKSELKKNK